jgi:hypothetical protein
MAETAELDTTQEAPSPNGHDTTWQTFTDDNALLQHILSKKPAEEEVEVPEWNVKILCRALNGEGRIAVEGQAYDATTKTTNYSRVAHLVVLYGCFNPTTGNRVFSDAHKSALKEQQSGGAIVRLFLTIMRLSGMLGSGDIENAKKN